MRIRDSFGIYHTLEHLLRHSDQPLTCVDLFDNPEVRKHADSANRVSDYLGHMYRRGLLGRIPAPKSVNSQARFAYFWKNRSEMLSKPKTPAPQESVPAAVAVVGKLLSKPNIDISENGGLVVIELPELTITIRPNR